jgi:hypothetical protein
MDGQGRERPQRQLAEGEGDGQRDQNGKDLGKVVHARPCFSIAEEQM